MYIPWATSFIRKGSHHIPLGRGGLISCEERKKGRPRSSDSFSILEPQRKDDVHSRSEGRATRLPCDGKKEEKKKMKKRGGERFLQPARGGGYRDRAWEKRERV